jgi:ABC-type amino acid transport substrate-binding protein
MTGVAVVALGTVVALTQLWPGGTTASPSATTYASSSTNPSKSPKASPTFSSIVDKAAKTKRLTIGVKGDLPGVGFRQSGVWTGFDVDVATFVARQLGVPASGITFKAVKRGDRVKALASGAVDLVVATYAYDHNGSDPVTFAGPYYTAHTDVLVLRGAKIATADDLDGKRLCNPQGSESVGVVQDRVPGAELVAAGEYAACIRMLRTGQVDAVPGDDVILAGFANREINLRFTVLGLKIDDSDYAVGLPKGDTRACSAVRAAIAAMYKEGRVARYLQANFGNVDFTPEAAMPAEIPCG